MSGPAPGVLGKIPAFRDFVRHNASSPAVEALDAWFQEGLVLATEVLGPGWQAAFDAAPPSVYVFQPPGTGRFAAGGWVPSRDASGRRYPFTVFLSGEAPGPRARPAALAAASGGFLEEALRLALELRARPDADPAGECARRLAASGLSGAHEGFLEETTVETFWTAVVGSFESPVRRAIAAGLEAAVSAAPAGRAARGPGIELPLPPGAPVATQAHFASAWADAAVRLAKDRAPPPLLFWAAGERPATSLFLFPGAPHPRQFLPLVRPESPGDHVWDLAAATLPPPEARTILEDPAATLAAALGTLAPSVRS